jgi:hypothetical protein
MQVLFDHPGDDISATIYHIMITVFLRKLTWCSRQQVSDRRSTTECACMAPRRRARPTSVFQTMSWSFVRWYHSGQGGAGALYIPSIRLVLKYMNGNNVDDSRIGLLAVAVQPITIDLFIYCDPSSVSSEAMSHLQTPAELTSKKIELDVSPISRSVAASIETVPKTGPDDIMLPELRLFGTLSTLQATHHEPISVRLKFSATATKANTLIMDLIWDRLVHMEMWRDDASWYSGDPKVVTWDPTAQADVKGPEQSEGPAASSDDVSNRSSLGSLSNRSASKANAAGGSVSSWSSLMSRIDALSSWIIDRN